MKSRRTISATIVLIAFTLSSFPATAATTLLRDLRDIAESAGSNRAPRAGVLYKGELYFGVPAPAGTPTLYRTDGTPLGTVPLDVFPLGDPPIFRNATELKAVGDYLYLLVESFNLNREENGIRWWRTDGTHEGTVNLAPSVESSNSLFSLGDDLYFMARDGNDADDHGWELWKTNGTPEGTRMVKDIRPGPDNGLEGEFQKNIVFDGHGYFGANDGESGIELWKTDGTSAGTVRVADINSGPADSEPTMFLVTDDALFFVADDGEHGYELWTTDGTSKGTRMVKDIWPGPNGSIDPPIFLTLLEGSGPRSLSGRVYYRADDGINGGQMWQSDGTEEGTIAFPGVPSGSSRSGAAAVVDDRLYFWTSMLSDAGEFISFDLWRTDGTVEGTVPIRFPPLLPWTFAPIGNSLYLSSKVIDPDGVFLLGAVQRVAPGSDIIETVSGDLRVGTNPFFSPIFSAVNGKTVFHGWHEDEFDPENVGFEPFIHTALDNVAPFLQGQYERLSAALSVYPDFDDDIDDDGLPEVAHLALIEAVVNGTRERPDLSRGETADLRDAVINAFDINFVVLDEETDRDLLNDALDATPALFTVSQSLTNALHTAFAATGIYLSGQYEAVTCDDAGLCMPVSLNGAMPELRYEAFTEAARATNEPLSGPGDIDEDGFTNAEEYANTIARGGTLEEFAIAALDPELDGSQRIFGSSGGGGGGCFIATAAYGTPLADDIHQLRELRDRYLLTNAPGALFADIYYRTSPPIADWLATHPAARAVVRMALFTALFLVNHAAAVSILAAIAVLAMLLRNRIPTLQRIMLLLALATFALSPNAAIAATTLLADLSPGAARGRALPMGVMYKGELHFGVHAADGNPTLYKTDGTPLGTVPVNVFPPGDPPLSRSTVQLRVVGDYLYLLVFTRNPNREDLGFKWWRTDGTSEGTVNLTPSIDVNGWLFSLGNELYFAARDGREADDHGWELWKTNGTPQGTTMVKDIWPGPDDGLRFLFISETRHRDIVFEGHGYFNANDGETGWELWRTDGSAAGTIRVSDINPGPDDSRPSAFLVEDATLFFAADDGEHGYELWTTDGTTSGTRLVKDIWPGPNGSMVLSAVPRFFSGRAYYAANDGTLGEQMWQMWQSDGTDEGTILFPGLRIEPFRTSPISVLDNRLYYATVDHLSTRGDGNLKLWRTDGTAAGTVLIQFLPSFVWTAAPIGKSLYLSSKLLDPEGVWQQGAVQRIAPGNDFVETLSDGLLVGTNPPTHPVFSAVNGKTVFRGWHEDEFDSENVGWEPFIHTALDNVAPFLQGQYERLSAALSVYSGFDEDLDNDGLPEVAHLALIEAVVNGTRERPDLARGETADLREATINAFEINFVVLDEEADRDLLNDALDATPALFTVSQSLTSALHSAFAATGIYLNGRYEAVTCDDAGLCMPVSLNGAMPELRYEAFTEAARATNEPLSGPGDIDEDGFTNAEEYANTIARGGTLEEFAIAALDPELDGSQRIFGSSGGGGGGCFIATAAYGTPLADDIHQLRELRDRYLLTNAPGALFADAYYRASPPIADWLATHDAARVLVRTLLAVILFVLQHATSTALLILTVVVTKLRPAARPRLY